MILLFGFTKKQLCLESLVAIIPDAKDRSSGSSILRTSIAYRVLLKNYERDYQNFAQSTNIENLLSIGRNGEFLHIFMEDVYWRTLKKVSNLITKFP